MVESSVMIDGITCSACAVTIEQALGAMPGVQRADVSAASRRATVVWSPDAVQPSQWMGEIRKVGYLPLPANDSSARAARLQESRTMLWRWLVANRDFALVAASACCLVSDKYSFDSSKSFDFLIKLFRSIS